MKLLNRNNLFLLLTLGVYALLTIISVNFGYFWDTPQLISKEAHWFYLTDFSSLLLPAPNSGSELIATGYHPPLMGIMTAALWKVFGYKLWVSHVFGFLWAIILIYNSFKLISKFFSDKQLGWVLPIALLESTLLAQFTIASPDFILFTAFVVSLRAIFENKKYMLAVAIVFLSCVSMRGVFIAAIMFVVNCYYTYLQSDKKLSIRSFVNTLSPYLPAFILLVSYYSYYLVSRGWFFTNSPYAEHYAMPNNFQKIIAHLAGFIIRLVENGRIFMWLLSIYIAYKTIKSKSVLDSKTKMLILFFILLTALYLLFVFITQMPFSSRYFMPIYFVLTILMLQGVIKYMNAKRVRLVFILVLFFQLTGHFWIYPEKTAKSWEGTLAHLPYYELREECFNYIDSQKLDYNDISAGFCLYGNRRFIELNDKVTHIVSTPDRKYFIYSNISNLEDEIIDELKNTTKWASIKEFKKGFVFIRIYQKREEEIVTK